MDTYKFAVVKAGVVVNTIVFDSNTPNQNLLETFKKDLLVDEFISMQDFGETQRGEHWDGQKFFIPEPPAPPAPISN